MAGSPATQGSGCFRVTLPCPLGHPHPKAGPFTNVLANRAQGLPVSPCRQADGRPPTPGTRPVVLAQAGALHPLFYPDVKILRVDDEEKPSDFTSVI